MINLKKNDKLIIIIAVAVVVVAGIGIAAYTPQKITEDTPVVLMGAKHMMLHGKHIPKQYL